MQGLFRASLAFALATSATLSMGGCTGAVVGGDPKSPALWPDQGAWQQDSGAAKSDSWAPPPAPPAKADAGSPGPSADASAPPAPPNPLATAPAGYSEPAAALLWSASHAAYKPTSTAAALAPRGLHHAKRIEKLGLRVDLYRVPGSSPPVEVIAFRGTELAGDLLQAALNLVVDVTAMAMVPPKGSVNFGEVHGGFHQGIGWLWGAGLGDYVKARPNTRFWLTGHSLGASLATLAAPRVAEQLGNGAVLGVYTFGSPRVGDAAFRMVYDFQLGKRHFRVSHGSDLFTHMPPSLSYERDGLGVAALLAGMLDTLTRYVHVGRSCWYRRDGTLAQPGCTPAGGVTNSPDPLAAAWQQDFDGVLKAKGLLGAIQQMGAEHAPPKYQAVVGAKPL